MATIKWKLFGAEIYEEIKKNVHHEQDDNKDYDENDHLRSYERNGYYNEDTVNEEDTEDSVSDLVRTVFYTNTLKELYEYSNSYASEDRENESEQYISRLNELDRGLKLFFESSKDILDSLDEEFENIQGEDSEQLQNAVYNYANAVYDSLNNKEGNTERFRVLERGIYERVPFDLYRRLEEYFGELRELIAQGVNDDDEFHRTRAKVYARVRQLPKNLGSPYAERYRVYKSLQKYPKLYHSIARMPMLPGGNNRATVVYMLMDNDSFDEYFGEKYDQIIRYIQQVQEDACDIEVIVQPYRFQDAIFRMNYLISKSKVRVSYLGKDGVGFGKTGRCFSITDVYLKTGEMHEVLCFSGTFDSVDSDIQSKFGGIKEYTEAINSIVNSGKFSNPIWARTNEDIRYYFDNGKKHVTLKQICKAVNSGYKEIRRMFSCCERKFYSYLDKYNVSDVDEYKMFTKYNACEMCLDTIADFNSMGYTGNIIYGVNKSGQVKEKLEFDSLADDVSKGIAGINYKSGD